MVFNLNSIPVLTIEKNRTIQILFDSNSHPELPVSALRGVRPPKSEGSDGHRHAVETEIFICIEGEGTLNVDGTDFALLPGGMGFAMPDTWHTLRNDGDVPFVYYALFAPAMSLAHIREKAASR